MNPCRLSSLHWGPEYAEFPLLLKGPLQAQSRGYVTEAATQDSGKKTSKMSKFFGEEPRSLT